MANKNTNNRKHNQQKNIKAQNISKTKNQVIESKTYYHLIPVFIVLCIIPLIVRMKIFNTHFSQFQWYAESDAQADVFLYYKQWFFIVVAAVMALTASLKTYYNRKKINFIPIFIPLVIYAALSLLSAICSRYALFSFAGSFDLFESVFVLLGYGVVVYYIYLFINAERDFRLILYYIIGLALLMSLLGVFQFLGYDFFFSKLGRSIMIPEKFKNLGVTLNLEKGRVYLSLFNPDYVGVYVALILPVIFVMTFFQKEIKWIILSALSIIGLLVCAFGSKTLSGVLGLGTAAVFIPIFMWRYLVKRYYISIPVILILILGFVILNGATHQSIMDKFKNAIKIEKTEPTLTDLHTEDDGVALTYNGNSLKVQYITTNNIGNLLAYDSDGNIVNSSLDSSSGIYTLLDDRFKSINFGIDTTNAGVFYLLIDGRKWAFIDNVSDSTYYYINRFNRMDKMVKAPSAVFTGYETFASGRGYIWSRTIPLLKKYVFVGSGPSTFTMAFPQNDYLGMYQSGMEGMILPKPHNMYLQTGVQTGVLSLIAFLVFYFMYFISSVGLYIRGRLNSFYARFGLAIFIGTVSFMVTGLANDSNINTSPIFWTLLGVGIAINCKAKPLIMEEMAEAKARKAETVKDNNANK